MVLVDADFFIGLYLTTDPHHKTCLKLSPIIKEQLITSYDVIDEVVTKLTYIQSRQVALTFVDDLEKNQIIIIYPDLFLFKKAIANLKSQKTKHVSLTDCMNMAIAKEKKIKYILSFDKIYEKNGFKLVK